MRTIRIYMLLLFLLFQTNALFCQVVYTFTGNGNYSSATNWHNNQKPPATLPSGSEIIIDPISTGECVLDVQQTILPGAVFTLKPNAKLRIVHDFTYVRPPEADTLLRSEPQKRLVEFFTVLQVQTISSGEAVSPTAVVRKGDSIAMKYFDSETSNTYDFKLNEGTSDKGKMVFEGTIGDEYNTDNVRRTVTLTSPTSFKVVDERKKSDGS